MNEGPWRPTWAVVVAVLALAQMPLPALWAFRSLSTGLAEGDTFGVWLGVAGLGVVAAVVLPLTWFLLRGGAVPFWVGLCVCLVVWVGITVLVALSILSYAGSV